MCAAVSRCLCGTEVEGSVECYWNAIQLACVTMQRCWMLMKPPSTVIEWTRPRPRSTALCFFCCCCLFCKTHTNVFRIGSYEAAQGHGLYALCVVRADYLLGLIICLSFWVQHRLSLALHRLLPVLLRLQRHTEGQQICSHKSYYTCFRVYIYHTVKKKKRVLSHTCRMSLLFFTTQKLIINHFCIKPYNDINKL